MHKLLFYNTYLLTYSLLTYLLTYLLLTYLLTYSLTHSTVQSPSWAADWLAASQEIPHISRNPKVHHRTHKRPPSVSILGQPNPVHIPTSHLLEIHPNIIHPSRPRSPQWSLSLRFLSSHLTPIEKLNRRMGGPHSESCCTEEGKISCPYQSSNPESSIPQPSH